ncbi:MAG: hypothetical protein H7235_10375 [Bdellovibrionaceae bacterium]|nr:hypothetical protein [Pseudobdellovibrionaceae bacterium]
MKWLVLVLFLSQMLAETAFSQVPNPNLSSYPQIILDVLSMTPRWKAPEESTSECLNSLNQPQLNPSLCHIGKKLNPINSFRSKLFFDFDAEGKYGFKNIDFQQTPTLKVRGLIGLHNKTLDQSKRPLVIFRMGIHGNRDEFMAERFLIKILYQDLGYHVLMLESLTSHGFVMANEKISFGGLEEGLQTFYILNQIYKKEFAWADQIAEIHMMALSMGGEGTFLTTYLDEQTIHQIKSVQVFCPLINLEKTFDHHSQPGLVNAFGDLWNSLRLKAFTARTPELQHIDLWKMIFDWTPRFSNHIMKIINAQLRGPLLGVSDLEKKFPYLKIPEDFKQHLKKSHSFYQRNNFWPVFKNEKTPIEVVVTPNDIMAINELNSNLIRNGQQPGIFKNVTFIDLEGFHCGLAQEYQWPFLVELVRRGMKKN